MLACLCESVFFNQNAHFHLNEGQRCARQEKLLIIPRPTLVVTLDKITWTWALSESGLCSTPPLTKAYSNRAYLTHNNKVYISLSYITSTTLDVGIVHSSAIFINDEKHSNSCPSSSFLPSFLFCATFSKCLFHLKVQFTLGVRDSSVESPNNMLVI